MNTLLKLFARAVIYFIALSMLIACTYRDPRIGSASDSTTIKGYYWPEAVEILVDDDKNHLLNNLQNTMSYYKYVGTPGRKCVIVEVDAFPLSPSPSCPICFTAKASETYQVNVNWDFKLDWELMSLEYIYIVEESTGKIVAKQDKFCKNWDCSECNLPEIEKTTGE